MMLAGALKAWGNSYGLRISKKDAARLRLREGTEILIDIKPVPKTDGFGIFKGGQPYQKDPHDDIKER